MKKPIIILLSFISLASFAQPGADEIIDRVDKNMSAENQIVESQMIIHGRRASRTITSVSYTVGDKKSFTEYLSPPREEGTKMLKLEDQLWIYSPSTDRTIQISGHMLRQSVMGSDLSYEDMMDDRKLTDVYAARVTGSEEIDGRQTWVLDLEATVTDIAYASRRVWIDKEKYVPLKEELYAKSGQLLKRSSMSDIQKVEGRWYPMTIVYKDMMKLGDGTEFKIIDIKFNQDIPEYMFTKAALKQ
ncbi:MAG: outer membrane lipoprotein-sorting protein [Bacteroidales bacterium]|nr:outer membrane lipoprotein-sorting protein [Bacteroidales bacterium]